MKPTTIEDRMKDIQRTATVILWIAAATLGTLWGFIISYITR